MPHGHIRGLSQFYVDGLERMEIWIEKRHAAPLPYHDNTRTPITLRVGNEKYDAGLRTTRTCPLFGFRQILPTIVAGK